MSYQELANNYYAEYRQQSIEDYESDLKRWESVAGTIRSMPLAEKAEYANYVTKKMCSEHPDITREYTYDEVIPGLQIMNSATMNTCAIGNIAAHLMLLPENEREKYNTMISEGNPCTIC